MQLVRCDECDKAIVDVFDCIHCGSGCCFECMKQCRLCGMALLCKTCAENGEQCTCDYEE